MSLFSLARSKSDNVNNIRYFVEHQKVDVNMKDKYNQTALIYAASLGNKKICEFLLFEAGCDVNVQCHGGWTAAMISAKYSHYKILRMCIYVGYDLDLKNDKGDALLKIAEMANNYKIVTLAKRKYKEDSRNKINETLSILPDNLNIIIHSYLFRLEDSKNDYKEVSLFSLARSKSDNVERIRYFFKHQNFDVEMKDEYNQTALIFSACSGNIKITKFLLFEAKCDVNAQTTGGYTAAMFAAQYSHDEILKLCIEAGCDLDLKNDKCEDVQIIAKKAEIINKMRGLDSRIIEKNAKIIPQARKYREEVSQKINETLAVFPIKVNKIINSYLFS